MTGREPERDDRGFIHLSNRIGDSALLWKYDWGIFPYLMCAAGCGRHPSFYCRHCASSHSSPAYCSEACMDEHRDRPGQFQGHKGFCLGFIRGLQTRWCPPQDELVCPGAGPGAAAAGGA